MGEAGGRAASQRVLSRGKHIELSSAMFIYFRLACKRWTLQVAYGGAALSIKEESCVRLGLHSSRALLIHAGRKRPSEHLTSSTGSKWTLQRRGPRLSIIVCGCGKNHTTMYCRSTLGPQ